MRTIAIPLFLIIAASNAGAQNGWFLRTGVTSTTLSCVHFTDVQNGTAVGNFGLILRTTDGGTTWTDQTVAFDNYLGVSFTDSSTGTIVGNGGVIMRTTDAGATWVSQTSGVTTNLLFVHFVDEMHGTAVGGSGLILRTNDGGQTWTEQTSGVTNDLLGVHFLNPDTGTVVGVSEILRTNDGGAVWTVQPNPSEIMYGVRMLDETTGVIAGANGLILRTTDGGESWEEQTSGVAAWLYALTFIDENTGWAAGNSGTIVRTTDGGITWEEQDTPTSRSLRGIAFGDSEHGHAVGLDGTILYTSTGGVVTSVASPAGPELPGTAKLLQNYPNPFNPSTTIEFSVAQAGFVSLTLFDLLGREAGVLVNERLAEGTYVYRWDARALPAGIYFYRLTAGSAQVTRAMVLTK